MSYLERLKEKKVSGGGLPKLPKPTKPLVSAVSAVSAVPPRAHLKIISKDDAPAPAAERAAPPAGTRPALRFKLVEGGGTVLGQPDDTAESLLAGLVDKWPDELVAVWRGIEQIYPDRENTL